jgi:hypothetical protein
LNGRQAIVCDFGNKSTTVSAKRIDERVKQPRQINDVGCGCDLDPGKMSSEPPEIDCVRSQNYVVSDLIFSQVTLASAQQFDVLILGAGMAGLTAARVLWEGGVTNFRIVEQSGQIGGRIWDVNWGGMVIEKVCTCLQQKYNH